MLYNLPRQLLWGDKKSMDEFFELEPMTKAFHEVFASLRREPYCVEADELKVFNEVFYLVTRMEYEYPKEERLPEFVSEIQADFGWNHSAELILSMVFFVTMLIDDDGPRGHHFIKKAIEPQYDCCIYWMPFRKLHDRMKSQGRRIHYAFKPSPAPAQELQDTYIDWEGITDGYNLDRLQDLILLWSQEEDDAFTQMISDSLPSDFFTIPDGQKVETPTFEPLSVPKKKLTVSELLELVSRLKKEKIAQNMHIAELEAENRRISALLEQQKSAVKAANQPQSANDHPEYTKYSFFQLFDTYERQTALREVIEEACDQTRPETGRDWLPVYIAYHFLKGQLRLMKGYTEFFADLDRLLPGWLPKAKANKEKASQKYKSYAESLAGECSHWFCNAGNSLPRQNEWMSRDRDYGVTEKWRQHVHLLTTAIYKRMAEITRK